MSQLAERQSLPDGIVRGGSAGLGSGHPKAAMILLCLLCLISAPVHGSGGITPEMGTRKTAMGAVIGRPDDLAAIYHNPAGLVLSPGTGVLLNAGLSLIDMNLRLRPWASSGDFIKVPTDADGYYPGISPSRAFGVIPMLVVSTNLGREDLVGAVGVYIPNAVGAAFEQQSVARYHLIDSYIVSGAVTVAVAWRPIPSLALGLGASLLYSRLYARRVLFPVLDGKDLRILFKGQSELELSGDGLGFGASLGAIWWPHPDLSVGAVVITRTDMTLEGDVTVTLGPDTIYAGKTMEGKQRTETMLPWTLQTGVNWQITSWLEIGGEFRYYFYSQFQQQRTEIDGLAIIKELISLKHYHDSWHVGAGLRVQPPWVPGLELMIGAHHDYSPAPDSTVGVDNPSLSHHGLRAGVRYRLHPAWRLALTYVHYWYVERSTDSSLTTPPANFQGDGVNNIITLVLEATLAGRSTSEGRP